MRYALILFALAFGMASCTPNGGPDQMVELKDGRKAACRLLSVRPESIVVDISDPLSEDLKNVKPLVIRIDDIYMYHYDPVSASKTILLTTLSGMIGGAIVGGVVNKNEYGSEPPPPLSSYPWVFLGTVLGAITGVTINDLGYCTYDPSDSEDLEELARHALFQGEEPNELKRIK